MSRPITVDLTLEQLAALVIICRESDYPAYRLLGNTLAEQLHAENKQRAAVERQQDALNGTYVPEGSTDESGSRESRMVAR